MVEQAHAFSAALTGCGTTTDPAPVATQPEPTSITMSAVQPLATTTTAAAATIPAPAAANAALRRETLPAVARRLLRRYDKVPIRNTDYLNSGSCQAGTLT